MNDWQSRTLIALIPAGLAGVGWLISIETRLQMVASAQQERGPRIERLEEAVDALRLDQSPRPQAKFMLDEHARRIERLEARVNSLHEYLIQLPIRPPPYNGRRGDLPSILQRQP